MSRSLDVAEIKRRIDLAAYVARFVALKRSGRGFLGLCPFHQEKTPSFHIDSERGAFHCFGCGAHGDVFTFMMRINGVTFREALRQLASLVGMPLSSERATQTSKRSEDDAANQRAATDRAFTDLWNQTIGELDDARDDEVFLRWIYRADPDLQTATTKALMASINGDPYLRDEVALERIAGIDDEWRRWREENRVFTDTSWALRILDDQYTLDELDRGIAILREIVDRNQNETAR